MNNGRIDEYLLCKDYKRVQLDFNTIQRDPENPKDDYGCGLYPKLLSHKVGSSYVYKISKKYFFKRNQQDGNGLASDTIISLHHYNKKFNALYGSLDDVAETACYLLSKRMINPKTGEKLVDVAEYALAYYDDENDIRQRGCITTNVCTEPDSQLFSMADILQRVGSTGNTINVYMESIKKYCELNKYECDFESVRKNLIKNSYFCWKVANSDNHKNNISLILNKGENGKFVLSVAPLIDNGSAYELSAPYYIQDAQGNIMPRFLKILNDPEYSTVNDEGNREFAFAVYPHMHTALHLDADSLLLTNNGLAQGKTFAYEYCLASEMLENPELFYEIAEIEKQFDLESMQKEFDETYGTAAYDNKFNWPPLLKEYMKETNDCKSRTLAFIVADYYLFAAYTTCFESVDREKPTNLYNAFRDAFLSVPLLDSKEAYDELFVAVAKSLGYEVDKSKLAGLKFKKEPEMKKPENQPN